MSVTETAISSNFIDDLLAIRGLELPTAPPAEAHRDSALHRRAKALLDTSNPKEKILPQSRTPKSIRDRAVGYHSEAGDCEVALTNVNAIGFVDTKWIRAVVREPGQSEDARYWPGITLFDIHPSGIVDPRIDPAVVQEILDLFEATQPAEL